ncbi:Uu.00g144600.m01.CDS01 [Anthostomella pinea]|uniref:Uu.00g144600.m01.CDS01 n=1 Tax=Anthostomella pinea TaxID=933095 RepID=A0AAI8VRP9_9PEZI|nr:Uu.00g144600.m01.CDS01 [Anthostomella pinea]
MPPERPSPNAGTGPYPPLVESNGKDRPRAPIMSSNRTLIDWNADVHDDILISYQKTLKPNPAQLAAIVASPQEMGYTFTGKKAKKNEVPNTFKDAIDPVAPIEVVDMTEVWDCDFNSGMLALAMQPDE